MPNAGKLRLQGAAGLCVLLLAGCMPPPDPSPMASIIDGKSFVAISSGEYAPSSLERAGLPRRISEEHYPVQLPEHTWSYQTSWKGGSDDPAAVLEQRLGAAGFTYYRTIDLAKVYLNAEHTIHIHVWQVGLPTQGMFKVKVRQYAGSYDPQDTSPADLINVATIN